jgi:hypothetical protein
VRTALAATLLALLAAISLASHWGGSVTWETDALFYQAKTEEIRGTDAVEARKQVFEGPLSDSERQLEVETPSEPPRVSDQAWVEYSAAFYARRLALPAAAAALHPLLGVNALESLSLFAFVLIPALLFLLLRRRLSLYASFLVSGAVILWPPLRAWSVFPMADSTGVALLIASMLCGLLAIERSRRWLLPWTICVAGLAFTRDLAFLPVISALALLAVRRDARTAALVGCGVLAAIPALLIQSVSESKQLAYVFANHTIPTDTSWGFVLSEYPANLGHMVGRYADYAIANPLVVALALAGLVAAFALAPRRDPLTILLWGTFPGYLLMLAIGPAFSGFRYELVLLPLIALGYGHAVERLIPHLRRVANERVGLGRRRSSAAEPRPREVTVASASEK